MYDPVFKVDIPETLGELDDHYMSDTSKQSVVCLVGAVGSPEIEAQVDQNRAQLLDIYRTKGNVHLICLDALEGELLHHARHASSPKVEEWIRLQHSPPQLIWKGFTETKSLRKALKRVLQPLVVYGIDDLNRYQKMLTIQQYAQNNWTTYSRAFSAIRQALVRAAPDPHIKKLIELRSRWDALEGDNSSANSRQLLEIAQGLNIDLPQDMRIILTVFTRQSSPTSDQEYDELKQRLKNCMDNISDNMLVNMADLVGYFMGNVSGDPLENIVEHCIGHRKDDLRRNMIGSSPIIQSRIEHCRDVIHTATSDGPRMREMTIVLHKGQQDLFGGDIKDIVLQAENLKALFDMAHILGINVSCYPGLVRLYEGTSLLALLITETGRRSIDSLMDIFDGALGYVVHSCSECGDLLQAAEYHSLLENIAQLALTPDQGDQFLVMEDHCYLRAVIEVLLKYGIKLDDNILNISKDFDNKRDYFRSFDKIALERVEIMANRTIDYMKAHDADKAVLLCLGFYAPAICRVFKDKNVAYRMVNVSFPVM